MATFVVAHGAWSAGFAWRKMHPLMQAAGHRLVTPSYTGLGERIHLAHKRVDLDTHITDVANVLFHEDLSDVVLVGHSYGGMVATGLADRVPERLRQVIYLDAFIPRDGQSLFGILGPEEEARRMQGLKDGWQVAPSPIPPDTTEADRAWLMERRHYQPIETVRQPVRLIKGETKLPRSYVYCARNAPGDVFRQFYDRAQAEGWPAVSIDASHSPHVTAPDLLMRTLADLLI